MSAHLLARLRITMLLFFLVLMQTALGADMRVAQVAPDLMVLVTICAGFAGGAETGAWVGFFAGIATDLFLATTPLGLSAMTYCLVGAAVGGMRASVLEDHWALVPVSAFVGTATAVVLFVGIGDVLGQSQLIGAGRSWLIRVALVEALWAAVLALPMTFLYTRLARGSVGMQRMGSGRRTGVEERAATR